MLVVYTMFTIYRCPKYDNVPSTCTFVVDPKDPKCCRVPQCQGTATGTGGSGVQGFTGSFVGYGRPPNVDPTTLAKTGYGSNYSVISQQI